MWAWIEQLNTRRLNHNLACVVAVSTTGFSPGAIDAAKKFGVQLRTVDQLTEGEIRGFLPRTAPLIHNHGHADHISLTTISEGVSLDDPAIAKVTLSEERNLPSDNKLITELATGRTLTGGDLWNWVLQNHSHIIFQGIPYSGERIKRKLTVPRTVFAPFRIIHDNERLEIAEMKVDGEFWRSASQLPLVMAVNYGKDSERPTLVAKWQGNEEVGVHEVMVIMQKCGKSDAT